MSSNQPNGPLRVLIADDDPVIRHWLTAMLEGEGYQVVSLSDGGEVFRLLQSDSNFAAAVFDLSMPHLNGPDLIRHMRTEKRLMRIPVMLITAESQIDVVAKGMAAGATVLLPKPFTRSRLQSTLRMMLRRKPGAIQTSLPANKRPDAPATHLDRSGHGTHQTAPLKEVQPEIPQPEQPVDLKFLKSLGEGEADEGAVLIVELIDLYLDSAAQEVTAIKLATEELNPSAIRRRAHSLKGSSATIGASGIASLCDQLDEAGQAHAANKAHELVTRLEREFASVRKVLLGERQGRLGLIAA